MNVAGRNIRVIAAIVFIEEPSFNVAPAILLESFASCMVAFVSRCVIRLKIFGKRQSKLRS